MKKKGYTYILTNRYHTVLYVGVTAKLKQRLSQHQCLRKPCFTSQYRVTKLVYFESYEDIKQAIVREKYIKGKRRAWKEALIEKENPSWNDLSS